MSTSTQGVSLADTTPAMLASGGPFFGYNMTEPTIISMTINRASTVKFGELKALSLDAQTESDRATVQPQK